MTPSLSCVHIIYSLLIEKDICDRQNVSIKLLCVFVCLSSRDLLIFWVSFLFFCILQYLLDYKTTKMNALPSQTSSSSESVRTTVSFLWWKSALSNGSCWVKRYDRCWNKSFMIFTCKNRFCTCKNYTTLLHTHNQTSDLYSNACFLCFEIRYGNHFRYVFYVNMHWSVKFYNAYICIFLFFLWLNDIITFANICIKKII